MESMRRSISGRFKFSLLFPVLLHGGILPAQTGAELVQSGPSCITLVLTNDVFLRGGEVSLAYDETRIELIGIGKGPGFPGGGELRWNCHPPVLCTLPDGVTRGIIAAWICPEQGTELLPPGAHELLTFCFAPAGEAEPGTCSPLKFVNCLGARDAPSWNLVTTEGWRSVPLWILDGEACAARCRAITFDTTSSGEPASCDVLQVELREESGTAIAGRDVPVSGLSGGEAARAVAAAFQESPPQGFLVDLAGEKLRFSRLKGGPFLVLLRGAGESEWQEVSPGRLVVSCGMEIYEEPSACAHAELEGICGAQAYFRRGDVNDDGYLEISDVIRLLLNMFLGTVNVLCRDAADSNDDGEVDITDAVYVLNYLFRDGPQPPPPHPHCGPDPTPDEPDCVQYTSCQSG